MRAFLFMKHCIDCKHLSKEYIGNLCAHPSLGTDIVTGAIKASRCYFMRADRPSAYIHGSGLCGTEGKLFEARKLTLREKIWHFLRLK